MTVYIAMFLMSRIVALACVRRCREYRRGRWSNHAFGGIYAASTLLLAFLLINPLRSVAAASDQEAVLAGTHQRIETLDYRVTGRLTRVEGNGARTNYRFVIKGHWFPDGLRLLCEITDSASTKTRLLLHMSVNGRLTIEAVQPGDKAPSAVPFERWNDRLLGTDFSYEDLVEGQFFWKNQELLTGEKYGARDCFVLKSASGPQDRTYYESATSWVDRGIYYPVHVVKTLRGTGQQKDFVYYGLRQTGGVWSASQVEVKLQGKPGSSLFVIEGGTGKAKLVQKDFDLSQLEAGVAK
jgi:Outer membrane lipoprotein-sorting protein